MKLKQKLALSLGVFYVLSVIGIALSMHFCGGKLASVAVYSKKTACEFCKTEASDKKDDGCCKNTKVEVKVKDSHQAETTIKLPKLFSFETLFPARIHQIFKSVLPSLFNRTVGKSPPKSAKVALNVLHCVFRN